MEVGVIDTLYFSKGANFSNLSLWPDPLGLLRGIEQPGGEGEKCFIWQGKVTFQNSNRHAEPELA